MSGFCCENLVSGTKLAYAKNLRKIDWPVQYKKVLKLGAVLSAL
jgi:hypothetical protein